MKTIPKPKNRVYGLPNHIQTLQTLLRQKRGRANRTHEQTLHVDPFIDDHQQMHHLTALGACMETRSSGSNSISLRPPRVVRVIYPLAIQSAKFLLERFGISNPAEVGA